MDTLNISPPIPMSPQLKTDSTRIVFSEQFYADYQPDYRAMWSRWNPLPRPCFNPNLLGDLQVYCDWLANSNAQIEYRGKQHAIEYVVLASDHPTVFNLGGDLDLFAQAISAGDRNRLLDYGRACIDVLYSCYTTFKLPITTIALVQGDALGGGFETALSCDIIVAEQSARFGFPEILFDLFPGMGAYTFLDRRIGQRSAEELISSGKIYTAQQMLAQNLIDFIVEDGCGDAGVAELIDRRKRRHNSFVAIGQTRRRVHQIQYTELLDIVEIWVDCALRLSDSNLKLMRRLVSRQNGIG